jgi:hypothetical protein
MLMRRIFILAALVCGGCGQDGEPAPQIGDSRHLGTQSTISGNTSAMDITWPSASRIDQTVLAAVSPEARAELASAPVPVLLPSAPELASRGVLVVKEHWYSFSARHDDLTVFVSATKLAHHYPSISPVKGRDTVRGIPGFVTRNEGIWSATWIEHGASYTLEIECANPAEPRCASDELLLQVAGELAYVGGRGARGAK